MSMHDKNHYNIVIKLQLIKINGKKRKEKKKERKMKSHLFSFYHKHDIAEISS